MGALAERPRRRIKRVEYDRMIEAGLFQGEKLELLRGELVEMSPIGTRHPWTVMALAEALYDALQKRARVRSQQPFVAADESEPEPDVALAESHDPRRHPERAYLLVEVADSSRESDLGSKAVLYAESDVAEYWVVDLVDLVDDVVHVHRDRADGGWRTITTHAIGERLSPLRYPDVVLELGAIIAPR